MRHFLITLTIATASIFSNNSQAADRPAPIKALAAFASNYANPIDTKWESVGDCYKATFLLDGRYALALYSADGTPLAVSKKISSAELPAKLRVSLEKELTNSWVSDLFVVSSDQGDEYYVTLENANTKVVLKSLYGKKWKNFQTIAK